MNLIHAFGGFVLALWAVLLCWYGYSFCMADGFMIQGYIGAAIPVLGAGVAFLSGYAMRGQS